MKFAKRALTAILGSLSSNLRWAIIVKLHIVSFPVLVVLFIGSVGGNDSFAGSLPTHDEPLTGRAQLAQVPPETSRNENSTPRNSVLPASPAIAAPPGAGPSDVDPERTLQTKAKLLKLGYDVGSLDESMSARFKATLFKFQKANGLNPSGKLDHETFTKLEARK